MRQSFPTVTIAGRAFQLIESRFVPFVRGGDGPEDPPADPPKAFSQDDVNRMATEADKAKRQAAKDLADRLGMSVDDALAVLKAKRSADDAALSEADKAKRDAEADRAAAGVEREQVAAERLALSVERALVRAGVAETLMVRAVRMVEVEPGASADDVAKAVESLRKDLPALFGQSDDKPVLRRPRSQAPAKNLNGGASPSPSARERHGIPATTS